uniref:DUF4773 domain-containing protein n=1 Tax=Gongylonema pulchrum TaxID=637853 RepID=A0A183EUY9_9BILA
LQAKPWQIIEADISSISAACTSGCKDGGVELKTYIDKRLTGYRIAQKLNCPYEQTGCVYCALFLFVYIMHTVLLPLVCWEAGLRTRPGTSNNFLQQAKLYGDRNPFSRTE